jgi:hypothetical protein
VIVAGQEFSVPAETENETIREQLKQMGFADVASATIQAGKKPDGTPTVEFVKKAGVKGGDFSPAALVGLLATVPADRIDPRHRSAARIVRQLMDAELTWDEALHLNADNAINEMVIDEGCGSAKGAQVCTRLNLPAVAAAVPVW